MKIIQQVKEFLLNTLGMIMFIGLCLLLAIFYKETIDIHNDMRIS